MPAGVGWSEYLKFFACAMLSMMAGSQLVHMYYKPLDDLKEYIEREELSHHIKDKPEINKNMEKNVDS